MSFPEFGTIVEERKQEFPQFGTEVTKPLLKKEAGRHIARTASRIGETILGLPGDILSLPKKLIPLPKEIEPGGLLSTIVPTSEDLKKATTQIFGKTVEPQSETENLLDNIVQDATSLAFPVKGKIPFIRSIGTAVAGNLAQRGAEELGAKTGGQTAAKLGTFFLAGLTGKGSLKKFWTQKYQQAENAIPKNATLNAAKLESDLTSLESELTKGVTAPSKTAVLKPLNELINKIYNRKLDVKDAVQAKKDLNELRESLFEEVKGRSARKGARTKLNDISKSLDKSLESYGKQNPEFYEPYKAANEAYSGYQQSRKVGRWISNIIPYGKVSKPAILLLEALIRPSTLGATAAGYGVLKTGELATRMFKNPTLRKYYSGLIKDSINENKTGAIRNLRGIDNEIQKNPEEWGDLISETQQSHSK